MTSELNSKSTYTAGPMNVLVADSSQMRAQLLVGALRRRPEFNVLSCSLEADAILSNLEVAAVPVALLAADSDGSGWRELGILRRVHLAHPATAKVLLTESCDRELVVNAFRSGARGIFGFNQAPFRLLCKCIHRVRTGQVWANNEQIKYLIEAVTQVPALRVVNANGNQLLTPREEQVVALVADGCSNRDVATELGLSEHTVKKYLFRIFDKVGVSSRVELVLYAVSHGQSQLAEWVAAA
jgi:DNA-binding NarL/FixJ family response regulator